MVHTVIDKKKLFTDLFYIRSVEKKIEEKYHEGKMRCPTHLSLGQEGISAVFANLANKKDYAISTHRPHAHYLAKGGNLTRMICELYGKVNGCSKGRGGSMHLIDTSVGFMGTSGVVATGIPNAVGYAYGLKCKGNNKIVVCVFGDGAVEEGVVHESLNLARVLDVPVLFVVENNLFSSHMHISLRQPSDSTARFAKAHSIPFEVVDGNNVAAVADAAGHLIDQARRGEGPGFLEAVTFRWLGHVDWREDVDVGVKRSAKTLAEWRARDPVSRLEQALVAAGQWSSDQSEVIRSEIQKNIVDAWESAMADPWPETEALLDSVYAMRTDPSDG